MYNKMIAGFDEALTLDRMLIISNKNKNINILY